MPLCSYYAGSSTMKKGGYFTSLDFLQSLFHQRNQEIQNEGKFIFLDILLLFFFFLC